jgi:hypothetical protein
MAFHKTDFPFIEIKDSAGDYFSRAAVAGSTALAMGLSVNLNVWSVAEDDGIFTYGPWYHYVNVIGYVITEEAHDGETYFEEDTND